MIKSRNTRFNTFYRTAKEGKSVKVENKGRIFATELAKIAGELRWIQAVYP